MKEISTGDLVRIAYRKHELAAAIAVEPPDDDVPSVWGVLWGGQVRLVHIDNLEQITGGLSESQDR
jgi:hypothetical protein